MTKLEGLLKLSTYINEGIKKNVDNIFLVRQELDPILTNEELEELTSKIKDAVQQEAAEALRLVNNWGAVNAATGVGKSKIAIDKIIKLLKYKPDAEILIVVPTQRLRDTGWKEEFYKWNWNGTTSIITSDVWGTNIRVECYASLHNIKSCHFDYIILDEGHNITEENSVVFRTNKIDNCLWLSATYPDKDKMVMLQKLNIKTIYSISITEATSLGIIAPYEITVVTLPLDDKDRYIDAGTKDNPFKSTELERYMYFCNNLHRLYMGYIMRMQFIQRLRSKVKATNYILSLIPQSYRTVIFCGSKEHANLTAANRYYSKPTPPKKIKGNATPTKMLKYSEDLLKYTNDIVIYENSVKGKLDLFIEGSINRISCVEALNEGHNLPNVDIGLIEQLNSKQLDFIQRVGRILRYRPGHTGKIIVICSSETEDFNWVRKSLKEFDQEKIRWIKYEDILSGKEQINI